MTSPARWQHWKHELNASAPANEVLAPYWNFCVGAGRANEGLRASWLEHLKLVVERCGFRYVRFHGLFHDDMFVLRERDGVRAYNWQYVDDLFDRMLDIGARPFVELGFCPQPLATTPGTCFWWKAAVCPPSDYTQWADLVKSFVRHCVTRYGPDEVRTWFFEVWNEPNLKPFWTGTRSQYFELYKVTARAIKDVDAGLRVGGPATSNFVPDERFDSETEDLTRHKTWTPEADNPAAWRAVWVEAFLDYCARERLPVDFVSTHPYPTDWALDGHGTGRGLKRHRDSILHDLTWLRNRVRASAFPAAAIHLTEWSSSPSSRDHTHDFLQEAAYVLRSISLCAGLCDSLSYWTFTDVFEEGGAGPNPFHGGFGLVNYQGIPKPAFHAYRFLNGLGDRVLLRNERMIATTDSTTRQFRMIAWNYPEEVATALSLSENDPAAAEAMFAAGRPAELELTITGLKPGAALEMEVLDREHGYARGAWERMGSPTELSREQARHLRQSAMHTRRTRFLANSHGVLEVREVLHPWDVVTLHSS